MTIGKLLEYTGGSVNIIIRLCSSHSFHEVYKGIVDDWLDDKPYSEHEVIHITLDANNMIILADKGNIQF